eukprot:CAMPEP_0206494260 /NCGR_PEP_ID=MMETSP0324_2-20121206/47604_1 /ASSEMBLY_ACC=CAM_ASM_000836 /TAXON_ID=2866 /ORGANISM="Crypthecodinium cohnii, Strain Seligo" /LENGTH=253 /DNA_ID=CAMNT_0053977845 /DNA_START=164 /DNA_END=925 /DNA_ORIENTATION=+
MAAAPQDFLNKLSLDVNIVSDIICPWCYMGKRRLFEALNQFKASTGIDYVVHWHPWELASKVPKEGTPKLDVYRKRFRGDEAKVAAMVKTITAAGKPDGLSFNFDGIMGPSLDAHRLLWAVREKPMVQSELAEELFQGYHEGGFNPADRQFLLRAWSKAGQDLAIAERILDSDEGTEEVYREKQQAYDDWEMLEGVPHIHILINGVPPEALKARGSPMTLVIPGAQDVAVFLKVLYRAVNRTYELTQETQSKL